MLFVFIADIIHASCLSHRVLGPHKELAPIVIGFTVAVLISIYAPLTQAWQSARCHLTCLESLCSCSVGVGG